MSEVKFNKSGYEIRADVLDMAKDFVEQEYKAKFAGWEISAAQDPKTGEYVTKVDMPKFPGLEEMLSTAQKMYDFVNAGNKR